MLLKVTAAAMVVIVTAIAAEAPLPELRTEPTGGGSIFHIRNSSSQPLTAFLIELVGYPGSTYSYWQDDVTSSLIPAGGEKRVQVENMTVGAVPDYVKMQAAIYADGSTAGAPEKVEQLIARRRFSLEATRELIRRFEKAVASNTAKATLIAEIKVWAESMPMPAKANRNSPEAFRFATVRPLVLLTTSKLEKQSIEKTLESLRVSERGLAASKPAL